MKCLECKAELKPDTKNSSIIVPWDSDIVILRYIECKECKTMNQVNYYRMGEPCHSYKE